MVTSVHAGLPAWVKAKAGPAAPWALGPIKEANRSAGADIRRSVKDPASNFMFVLVTTTSSKVVSAPAGGGP
jgi:hypothetical protein